MKDLNAFQRDLLIAIHALDKPKGTDIKRHIESYYGCEIHRSRLYPNLDTLSEESYVEKGQKDDRSNEYQITESGRSAVESHREWIKSNL